jgi:hypothetical protein
MAGRWCECKRLATLAVSETGASDADVCSLSTVALGSQRSDRGRRDGAPEEEREAHLLLQDDPNGRHEWAAVECGRDEGEGQE